MGADILFTRIAVTPEQIAALVAAVSADQGQRHPQQD
jgi:hypothetical protein